MRRLIRSLMSLIFLLPIALTACDDQASPEVTPVGEDDLFVGSAGYDVGPAPACPSGDVCRRTTASELYLSTYRVGYTPTSRADLQQTFKATAHGLPIRLTLAPRHLRTYTTPSHLPAPRLHVGLYEPGPGGFEAGAVSGYFAEGSVALNTFAADGSTVPATFGPTGLAEIPITTTTRLTSGAAYGAIVWTDDLPVGGDWRARLGHLRRWLGDASHRASGGPR